MFPHGDASGHEDTAAVDLVTSLLGATPISVDEPTFLAPTDQVAPLSDKVSDSRRRYMKKVVDRHRQTRQARVELLKSRSSAVRRATEKYAELDPKSVTRFVAIDREFIALQPHRPSKWAQPNLDDVSTRPPLTRLLNYRNPHALGAYLSALFVTQQVQVLNRNLAEQSRITHRRPNIFAEGATAPWATLVGLAEDGLKPRDRRRRLTRTLDALDANGLVALGAPGAGRYTTFELCSERGSGQPWTIAKGIGKGSALLLPSEFFLRGWHLTLTSSELTTLLAIAEFTSKLEQIPLPRGRKRERGVALPESVRWGRYGLSDETYQSIHELSEFGLISVVDPMTERKRGRVGQTRHPNRDHKTDSKSDPAAESQVNLPYRLEYHIDTLNTSNVLRPIAQARGLTRDAVEVVTECMKRPVPPRFR